LVVIVARIAVALVAMTDGCVRNAAAVAYRWFTTRRPVGRLTTRHRSWPKRP